MDLINAQFKQKEYPYFKNQRGLFLNLITRKEWGFSKAIGFNPLKNTYTSFPILDEPIIGIALDKSPKNPNYEFSIEDMLSEDWVIFSEENIKNTKQEIINAQ